MKNRIVFLMLAMLSCYAITVPQVKYVQQDNPAIGISASFSKVASSRVRGIQLGYSRDGRIAIGAFYLRTSSSPAVDGAGLAIEGALLKPARKTAVGVNALFAFATTWSAVPFSTTYEWGPGYTAVSNSERSFTGKSLIIGAEIYVHSEARSVRPEPFVQFTRTFAKVGSSDYSESSQTNSFVLGVDFIVETAMGPSIVLSPSYIWRSRGSNIAAAVGIIVPV